MSFVLSIEIYNGKNEEILVEPKEEASVISLNFIEKHKLPFQFHEQITKQIIQCRNALEIVSLAFTKEKPKPIPKENSRNPSRKASFSSTNPVFDRLYNDSLSRSHTQK